MVWHNDEPLEDAGRIRHAANLVVERFGDEGLVFDPATQSAHHLSSPAFWVFGEVDRLGSSDLPELLGLATTSDSFDSSSIKHAVSDLLAAGILQSEQTSQLPTFGQSSDESAQPRNLHINHFAGDQLERRRLLQSGIAMAAGATLISTLVLPTPSYAESTCTQATGTFCAAGDSNPPGGGGDGKCCASRCCCQFINSGGGTSRQCLTTGACLTKTPPGICA